MITRTRKTGWISGAAALLAMLALAIPANAGLTASEPTSPTGVSGPVSGATQIRAGVIRPEIIIPRGEAAVGMNVQTQREGIRLGDPVRIIRDPLFGRIGEVSALPSELTKISTESDVRVLEVKFSDGKRVVIPRTNIEVIEGA